MFDSWFMKRSIFENTWPNWFLTCLQKLFIYLYIYSRTLSPSLFNNIHYTCLQFTQGRCVMCWIVSWYSHYTAYWIYRVIYISTAVYPIKRGNDIIYQLFYLSLDDDENSITKSTGQLPNHFTIVRAVFSSAYYYVIEYI